MLENKVAIVTGASRGIGAEIARTFAANKATVIVNYSGSKEKAEEVVNEIVANGGKALAYKCNVADFNEVKEMMEYVIGEYGSIDILVNNAGITRDNILMRMSEEDFDAVIDVNLKGAFNCMKNVTRQMMKQRNGRIINLSSVVGIRGNAGQINYSASKAGVIGMTYSMAKEIASRNITVNAIAPGFIETDMTDALGETVVEKILEEIPAKKLGSVKDVAQLALFLASDNAQYITGQVIGVDGGMGI